jgi:preprotein translocase subunit SecG
MTLFVEILYVLITVILILVVLLQAGRGGGLGTALGGGASQSVFGGSGGADFLAKLTQGLAIGFMVCAVYLAYAGAHTGSDTLKAKSEELEGEALLAGAGEDIDYERVGPNPLPLPAPGAKPDALPQSDAEQEAAPTDEAAPAEAAEIGVPADEETPPE